MRKINILFITSNRLGDAIISTCLLNHLQNTYPQSEITVACGPFAAGLFTSASNVVDVFKLEKEPFAGHWRKLLRYAIYKKWDIIVDLRNSFITRLLVAKQKYIWSKKDNSKHKVEQLAELMKLNKIPDLKLEFSKEVMAEAKSIITNKDKVIGVGPAANWAGKTWDKQNFIDLLKRLTKKGGIFEGYKIAVFAAPGEEEQALPVLNAFPTEKQINLIGNTSPELACACVKRCKYYIGNDSGLMHAAAAVNTPVMGLFGPSYPHNYKPWSKTASYISTPETLDELISFEGYDHKTVGSLMGSLTVDSVYDAILEHYSNISK